MKCLAGNRYDAHSTTLGIAVMGKVTPTIVALSDPNMDIKPIIKARLGCMANINTATDNVAATNSIHVGIMV